jgi:Ni/Fe-hydrogenase subunit HybB-like protein
MPEKLHPLWYSSFLPVFFYVSALGVGLSMVILESHLSGRAFGKKLEIDLLSDLARVFVVVQAVYLVWRFQDLAGRDALHLAWSGTLPGNLFVAEIALGSLIPMLLFAVPRVRRSEAGLFAGAACAVSGFVLNRLDVSITAVEAGTGVHYVPSWMEIAVTASIVAVGFALFGLAARHLPIFETEVHAKPQATPRLRRAWIEASRGAAAA